MYYTYMIRCEDNSIYTGITTDIERRFSEHISKGTRCAKYTLNHPIVSLEAVWESESRSLASKLEYHIKTLNKAQKEELIKTGKLEKYLSEKIDSKEYKALELQNTQNYNVNIK